MGENQQYFFCDPVSLYHGNNTRIYVPERTEDLFEEERRVKQRQKSAII